MEDSHKRIVGLSRAIIAYGGTINFILTEWLIRMSIRPAHVTDLTNIPETRTTTIWKDIHGENAPRGLFPDYAANLLNTRKKSIHASLFAYYYYIEGGKEIFNRQVPEALISAYNGYIKKVLNPIVTGEMAYMITRDLIKDSLYSSEDKKANLELVLCEECFAYHVKSDKKRSTEDCPFCSVFSIGFND